MLRAAAHPVGAAIAPHPAQGRDMFSVACLPQSQEEEYSQEEPAALYRCYTEVPKLSRSPADQDPSLYPLGCVPHLLFRCNACQGRGYAKNPAPFPASTERGTMTPLSPNNFPFYPRRKRLWPHLRPSIAQPYAASSRAGCAARPPSGARPCAPALAGPL